MERKQSDDDEYRALLTSQEKWWVGWTAAPDPPKRSMKKSTEEENKNPPVDQWFNLAWRPKDPVETKTFVKMTGPELETKQVEEPGEWAWIMVPPPLKKVVLKAQPEAEPVSADDLVQELFDDENQNSEDDKIAAEESCEQPAKRAKH